MSRRCRKAALAGEYMDKGFTLVELLVTLVIAMVILAGLLLSFQSQYGEYKYQNKRIDAVQDLEFVANFIANDIRSSLIISGSSTVSTVNMAVDPYVTTDLYTQVWESDPPSYDFWGTASETATTRQARGAAVNYQAVRHYTLVADPLNANAYVLRYDRNTRDGNDTPTEIMQDVTYFRIFQDVPGVAPAGFTDAPKGLPATNIMDASGSSLASPSYTILIEMAVDAGYKNGSFIDVRGNDVRGTADPRKRIWRYVQVHPMAAW